MGFDDSLRWAPDGSTVLCCLCFETVRIPDECYVDAAGVRWDTCIRCGDDDLLMLWLRIVGENWWAERWPWPVAHGM